MRKILFTLFLSVIALLTVIASERSPRDVLAAPYSGPSRLFYQAFSGTSWEPCPAATNQPGFSRYKTNYGCVAYGSVRSQSTIHSVGVDGSSPTAIDIDCASGSNPHWQAPWNSVQKIVVDKANNKIYWENSFEPGVGRVNIDGSNCELVANGGYYGKVSIAIDATGTYLYSVQNAVLRRITLSDGTVTNLTLTGLPGGFTPANYGDITVSGNFLYATLSNVSSAGHIMEVSLNTSSSTQSARLLVTSQPTGMNGVSVDATQGHIYWTTSTGVKRANLADGSNIQSIYSGSVNYVVVAPAEQKLIMGTRGNNEAFSTNLDGTNATLLGFRTNSFMTYVQSTLQSQVVTWSPSTSLTTTDSPSTPSSLATTSGNGAISYTVVSAGTTGCSVNGTSGLLTFTGVGTCTVRATAAATGSYSSATRDVTFTISAPPATTTTMPATTSTVSTSTTAAPTTTAAPVTSTTVAAPSTTAPIAQTQIARVVTSTTSAERATTTTLAAATTTTVARPVATTAAPPTTTTVPEIAEAAPGEAAILVGGEPVKSTVTRSNDQLVIAAGDMSATISCVTADGAVAPLDNDGNIRLSEGDQIQVEASGFAPNSDVEVWLFSTPTLLGTVTVNAQGTASAQFPLPTGAESGNHRVALNGKNVAGEDASFAVGIVIGSASGGVSTAGKVLIAIPIALAVLFALVLPARRRRKIQLA
jgi:hypothetical protein